MEPAAYMLLQTAHCFEGFIIVKFLAAIAKQNFGKEACDVFILCVCVCVCGVCA